MNMCMSRRTSQSHKSGDRVRTILINLTNVVRLAGVMCLHVGRDVKPATSRLTNGNYSVASGLRFRDIRRHTTALTS